MNYDWILDVLNDLKTFAAANGLKALAENLDDASLIAASEISRLSETAPRQGTEGKAETPLAIRLGPAGQDNA